MKENKVDIIKLMEECEPFEKYSLPMEISVENGTELLMTLLRYNSRLRSKSSSAPSQLILTCNSQGGNLASASAIIHEMNKMKEYGIKIYTVSPVLTCSAAALIFINGTIGCRYIHQFSTMLVHEPRIFLSGTNTPLIQSHIQRLHEGMNVNWKKHRDDLEYKFNLTESELILIDKGIDIELNAIQCLERNLADYMMD